LLFSLKPQAQSLKLLSSDYYRMAILENIEVWKKSVQLGKDIYSICRSNSHIKNDYGIRDQIQRSAVSIASNIAE
jgi:hypothetical protein